MAIRLSDIVGYTLWGIADAGLLFAIGFGCDLIDPIMIVVYFALTIPASFIISKRFHIALTAFPFCLFAYLMLLAMGTKFLW